MHKPLYILSGLGADERAFKSIGIPGYKVHFIKWIPPQQRETIQHYAGRLLAQIPTPDPILIGLSFGGMMAIEIASQITTTKIILIASAKTKHEIPFYYRIAGRLGLHHLVPASILKHANFFSYWLFGVKSRDDKRLFKEILHDTDPVFLKWAIGKVVRWKNVDYPADIFHIHGTGDHVLPIRYVKSNFRIHRGGHLITLTRAEELNQIIGDQLEPLTKIPLPAENE